MARDTHSLPIKTQADLDKAVNGVRWLADKIGQGWTVIITRKRGHKQNALLWKWLTQISQELQWHGKYWTPEQWKDCLMHAYKGGEFMPGVDGGFVPIGRSTSALGVKDFALFLDSVDAFAAQHGVTLPQPDEQTQRSAA